MGDATVDSTGADAPVRIFMSYRRADDRHFIGRLHDRLCEAFGDDKVFRDIDSIPAGTNFRNVILRTLNEVDAVVAVIGPNWARTSSGEQATSTDYVFLELAEALKYGKPVIPVLIETTPMPTAASLPEDMRMLGDIEAISVLGDPAFRRDSARLIEAISRVVADDRVRLARAKQEAEEQRSRVAAERQERERRAEELRAEERAARARLAELEEAAVQRQIEIERARVEALAAQLRQAEVADEPEPALALPPHPAPTPPPPVVEVKPAIAPTIEPPPALEHGPATIPWFEILVIAGLVLGVVSLLVKRTYTQSDPEVKFDELGDGTLVDITVWLSVLAVGIPLLLSHRPEERRAVLAGVTVSTVVFEFLHEAVFVRYSPEGFKEGSWVLVKLVQIACAVVAYGLLVRRGNVSAPEKRSYWVPLSVVAVVGAVLTFVATRDERDHVPQLVDQSVVTSANSVWIWIIFIALPPAAAVVVLAARGTYRAQVALAVIAPVGAMSFLGTAAFLDRWSVDGNPWVLAAVVYFALTALTWWVVLQRARRAAPLMQPA